MSTQDRAALEAERDFLLDSIRRLDNDKAVGAINETEYIDLRDEQTVRAAAVLAALDEPIESLTDEAKSARKTLPWPALSHKNIYWASGVLAFMVIAVGAVIGSTGNRLFGENSSGSTNADTNTLLQRASQQSGQGKVADAVKTYDQVLKQDPQNVQALAYKGWLIRLAGLPQEGLDSINQALAVNPSYPDAHFFKGFILFRDRNDPKDAVTEFNAFLADDPPSDLVPLVKETLQDAQAEAAQQK